MPGTGGPGGVPDFFIIGMPKCGTTALYHALRAHPQVFMPALKEPHFFSLPAGEGPREERPVTIEGYLELFADAPAGTLLGEASTSYLLSPVAAQRIAELNPDARIVAILREPVAYLRSLHLQLVKTAIETEPDLLAAMALEPQRRAAGGTGLWEQFLRYSEHIRWVEQLRRYDERFGSDRVSVLIYDDFRADNASVVREVMRFLEIDDTVTLEPTERNRTLRARESRGGRVTRDLALGRGRLARTVRTVGKIVPPRMRRNTFRMLTRPFVRKPPPPDERTTQELRRRFAAEVAAAGEYLGRDLLALWGYREPGAQPIWSAARGSRPRAGA